MKLIEVFVEEELVCEVMAIISWFRLGIHASHAWEDQPLTIEVVNRLGVSLATSITLGFHPIVLIYRWIDSNAPRSRIRSDFSSLNVKSDKNVRGRRRIIITFFIFPYVAKLWNPLRNENEIFFIKKSACQMCHWAFGISPLFSCMISIEALLCCIKARPFILSIQITLIPIFW